MQEDQIKNSFYKVKEDISSLQQEIDFLKNELFSFKSFFSTFNSFLKNIEFQINQLIIKNNNLEKILLSFINNYPKSNLILSEGGYINFLKKNPAYPINNPAQIRQTSKVLKEKNNKNLPFKTQKDYFFNNSTGNEGVPADRQTNQQTDKKSNYRDFSFNLNPNLSLNSKKTPSFDSFNHKYTPFIVPLNPFFNYQKIAQNFNPFITSEKEKDFEKERNIEDPFKKAKIALTSLDDIKKEIKIKINKLTDQEFLVLSTIYQLEEEGNNIDYKILSKKLNLTESSIRDYISKLLNKGAPIIKEKVNNKFIFIKISPEFKEILSLNSLILLRGS
jgi:DNA-binding MarR family transcriptional regulator